MKSLVNTIIGTLCLSMSLLYSDTPSIYSTPEKKDPAKALQEAQSNYSRMKNRYDQAQKAYLESTANLDDIKEKLQAETCSRLFIALAKKKCDQSMGACIAKSLLQQQYKSCISEGTEKAQKHKQECESKLNALKERLFEASQRLTKARQEVFAQNNDSTSKHTLPTGSSISFSPIIKQPNLPIDSRGANSYIHHHVTNIPVLSLATESD